MNEQDLAELLWTIYGSTHVCLIGVNCSADTLGFAGIVMSS